MEHKDIKLIIIPDLVLREKSTGKIILMDFKTSKPVKAGKKQAWDENKLQEYKNQTLLYAHFFEKATGIHVDKITLLFVRLNKSYDVEITEKSVADVLRWLENVVDLIRWEEDFLPNVQPYFCQNICSVRYACPFWQEAIKPKILYDYDYDNPLEEQE